MENNLRDNELIQRYLDRSATNEEKQELEYRLKEEPALQSLYKEHRQLVLGIRYGHLQNKLQQLKALERALPKSAVSEGQPGTVRLFPIQVRWVPWSAAAGVLIALSLWLLATQDTTPLNERLYTKHFEPFDSPGSGLTRSSDNDASLKARAYVAYDAGQYAEAAKLFEESLMLEKDDAIMHLCLGNAWLEIEQPEKAEGVFLHILKEHSDLVTQAKWYLALTYLKQGKMERTKATLWEISDSSTYGVKARKLLKELD